MIFLKVGRLTESIHDKWKIAEYSNKVGYLS